MMRAALRLASGALILLAAACVGCMRSPPPGAEDLPPLVSRQTGPYRDVSPRWSHDGRQIVFLRATPDRLLQLFTIDAELDRAAPRLEAELLCPDRPYDASLSRYSSPDTLAWSPDDRHIAFERTEWFTFDDRQRLPGTGLWDFDTYTGRVVPLAIHPARYRDLLYYYHFPEWSPDGKYLSFVGEGINGQRSIFIRPVFAQPPQKVVPRFDMYDDSDWPVWRPSRAGGTRSGEGKLSPPALAYRQGIRRLPSLPQTETLRLLSPGATAGAVWGEALHLTTARCERLLPAGDPDEAVAPRVGHPAWSPDGRRIAFTLTPDALDFRRYEVWVLTVGTGEVKRASPRDGRGYFAPVWIGNAQLGALSPRDSVYDVVALSPVSRSRRTFGVIKSADCDWSPDRSHIVVADPEGDSRASDNPTSLSLFETGVRVALRPSGHTR